MDGSAHNYWQGDDAAVPSEDAEFETKTIEPISWEASEYVHHRKSALWLVVLAVAGPLIAAGFYWFTRSITFTVLIVLMGVAVAIYAVRPPRTMRYQITDDGITINDRLYRPEDFRSFGVVQEDALYFIALLPVKRFLPPITVYFPAEQGEAIVDALGSMIPMERLQLDFLDNLVRKLRF